MLKAVATSKDGRKLLVLGLSRRNMELLMENKPIVVDTARYGIEGGAHIVLLGGETEESIQAEMAKHLKLPEPVPEPPAPQGHNPAWDTCPLCLYGDCADPTHQ